MRGPASRSAAAQLRPTGHELYELISFQVRACLIAQSYPEGGPGKAADKTQNAVLLWRHSDSRAHQRNRNSQASRKPRQQNSNGTVAQDKLADPGVPLAQPF